MPTETSDLLPIRIVGSTDSLDLGVLSPRFADREAQEFAEREGLEGVLSRAIKLISESFQVVAPLAVSLGDPSADGSERGLIIEVPVAGDPLEVPQAHWNYALKARALLGLQGERITAVCDVR
jgi:hypothetical protein